MNKKIIYKYKISKFTKYLNIFTEILWKFRLCYIENTNIFYNLPTLFVVKLFYITLYKLKTFTRALNFNKYVNRCR